MAIGIVSKSVGNSLAPRVRAVVVKVEEAESGINCGVFGGERVRERAIGKSSLSRDPRRESLY